MRLDFIFSRLANISDKKVARVKTTIKLPDGCQHLIGVEERIREIGRCVGILTEACLHVTCKDLGIANERMNDKQLPTDNDTFFIHYLAINILFKTYRHSRKIQIVAPRNAHALGIPLSLIAQRRPRGRRRKPSTNVADHVSAPSDNWCKTDEQRAYVAAIKSIIEQTEVLLNAEPDPHRQGIPWQSLGYHPYWKDSQVAKLLSKEVTRLQNLSTEKTNQKSKRAHGKGNRPGAIPGKFKGVQMRSQLEIGFAAEIEKRGIVWVYEEERLGEGNYLVDFHLPEIKMWIEVKGRMTARDEFLLKDVAKVLQARGESLYMFTSGSPRKVTPDGFEKIPRKAFWALLESLARK